MHGHEINMALAAHFWGRRTSCGREWAEMRSTWLPLLNSGDDALAAGENGRKQNQHGSRCSILETTHWLRVKMDGNEINALAAQFWRRRTSCEREWAEMRSTWL